MYSKYLPFNQVACFCQTSKKIFDASDDQMRMLESITKSHKLCRKHTGVAQPSLPCFVDATPSRVAGISGQGGFAFSLPSPRHIFEAEFLAFLYGIGTYLPISNNIHLIGDNLRVLFCLKRCSSRNLVANEFLKNLAYLWLRSPFFLDVSYIKSADNPDDFYTRNF